MTIRVVIPVYTADLEKKIRAKYQVLSPVARAKIVRYGSEHITPQTIEHFKDTYELKPTSVRNFESKYMSEI